ncbi:MULTISPECIES: DEAD/DEAH box helicase [Pseudomonas]|jgi:ATP-dependent RNA helicase SrmB|uniref:DEAD/DEAH box helicase n=2 Tax=Pseudomonas putida TaxID=303 RepID=A0A379KM98_PSEPU|nr:MULTISPECIES: DEAD/DEAH box helicase [Pseudomonas]QPN44167.1 DEAD/DEAH box helicase [Priestia aryabhattai]KAF1312614.1 RNA helicase [Pseudomonas sp. SG-MS2]MBG6126821.1 superfamily II DNA/RNA helicase [Pseudomonas sp. M2]MBM7397189.1 superfamily II DNA/RNA helicase [Pseudomonas sp. M5]MDH1573553.1 DEAD/DEAH box helicase [Pseudomonas sp. GD03746]
MQLNFPHLPEVTSVFSQFALHERLLKAVAELKFVEPTPVQAAAIPLALQGRDLRVTAQTGSGKTAAFVLPLLNRLVDLKGARVEIRALILLPTRELAQQTLKQVQLFSQFTYIKAGLVTGGEDFKEQAAMLRKVPDVLIGTPGRLLEQLNAGNLDLSHVQVMILDEADRMLDMGFAEDMERLCKECENREQTLLFSATTGGAALRDIIGKVLKDPEHLMLNSVSQLAEGTRQQVITADHDQHKEAIVQWLLANEKFDKAIIFTNTRVLADRIYGHLVAKDVKAFVLHGEKDQKDRKLAIERFKQGSSKVLVATDVAARGLDIDGLDLVINFDMPRSGDEYVHRIGRTGRAGGEGLAISLITHNDWNLMSSIERYLKQQFERRVIKEVKGTYNGPKKVKASGKAAGTKKKKTEKKTGDKKAVKRKPTAKPKANAPLTSSDGLAPLKKRKPAAE